MGWLWVLEWVDVEFNCNRNGRGEDRKNYWLVIIFRSKILKYECNNDIIELELDLIVKKKILY